MYPRYSYPIRMMTGLVRDALLRRHRRFLDDAQACIRRLTPPLEVHGRQNVPTGGGYVITPNHYYRAGFASQWSALAISAAVRTNLHWIMTAELTFPGHWIAPLGMRASRYALSRVADVYGFTAMPPMPPRPRDVARRAAAVRRVLRLAGRGTSPIIGLAPEGGDQPGGRLSMPPAGAGRFCLLLSAAGLRFLPVGVYEENGRLTLNFGEPYALPIDQDCTADEKDHIAAFTVMSRIAPLLPRALRGEFSDTQPALDQMTHLDRMGPS